jgi:DME family drug/metabolite transporter
MLIAAPAALLAIDSPATALTIAFLGIGPTLGGYGLFNLALRYIPGQVAGLITVMEVPISALIVFLLLGDTLEPPQLAGMVLVLIATVLPNLRGFRAPELAA